MNILNSISEIDIDKIDELIDQEASKRKDNLPLSYDPSFINLDIITKDGYALPSLDSLEMLNLLCLETDMGFNNKPEKNILKELIQIFGGIEKLKEIGVVNDKYQRSIDLYFNPQKIKKLTDSGDIDISNNITLIENRAKRLQKFLQVYYTNKYGIDARYLSLFRLPNNEKLSKIVSREITAKTELFLKNTTINKNIDNFKKAANIIIKSKEGDIYEKIEMLKTLAASLDGEKNFTKYVLALEKEIAAVDAEYDAKIKKNDIAISLIKAAELENTPAEYPNGKKIITLTDDEINEMKAKSLAKKKKLINGFGKIKHVYVYEYKDFTEFTKKLYNYLDTAIDFFNKVYGVELYSHPSHLYYSEKL